MVAGDAVYDQDRLLPQIAVGVQYKRNDQGAIVAAVGGKDDEGTDVYVAASKLLLGAVQPTMPPWARTMSRVAALNCGK